MAIYYLPARTDLTHYDFEVELEESIYTIELYWNTRAEAWFLSVYDVLGEPLVSGRKVALGAPILGRAERPSGPPGAIIAFDTSGENVEAGETDLGGRVQLVYFDSTEL